jgi:hypothetical protein
MTEAEWLACEGPHLMLSWLRRRKGQRVSERKLRLFACACCRRVWHLLKDPASRGGVATAERFADGFVGEEDVLKARDALRGGGFSAVTRALWLSSRQGLEVTHPETAAKAVAFIAASRSRRSDESRAQCALLRDVVGNPFRPVAFEPAWRASHDGAAIRLAQAIYEERAFDRLPLLADALEEAGCTDAVLLGHCRGGGEHARGCWAVDLVLGRA